MTTKRTYGFLAVAMAAIFGLAAAPTMDSAFATTTYVTSFPDGNEFCRHIGTASINTGSANSDGDLVTHADSDANEDLGSVASFSWKKMYFTSGTDITLLAVGTVDVDVNDGHAHIVAYLAPSSTMGTSASYPNCIDNGVAVTGSTATIVSINWNGSETGQEIGTSSFTIPSSGYYNVVIYSDAQTVTDGGATDSDISNPWVRLTY